jgi:hypothetical protein
MPQTLLMSKVINEKIENLLFILLYLKKKIKVQI